MIKRLLSVFILLGMLSSGMVLAGDYSANKDAQVFTGRSEYQNLKACLDFVADVMAAAKVKLNDVRVSPIIMSEQWYEFPIEFSWFATQKDLVPVSEKLISHSFAESRLTQNAFHVSCSAESNDKGEPFLVVTSQQKLICLAGTGKDKGNDLWPAVAKQNQQTMRALRSLLQITTFTPQVSKRIEKNTDKKVGEKTTWITNLRIDGDNRVQITGYGFDTKEITKLGDELFKSGSFIEISLNSMTKNVYERVPVWRFDIIAKIN